MSVKGQYLSPEYEVRFPQDTKSHDLYWYDLPIGSITQKYMNAGWSNWRWCSGSGIGDRMKVKDSNEYLKIEAQVLEEFSKQML